MRKPEPIIVFYKPSYAYLMVDLLVLLLSLFFVLGWMPLTTEVPFQKYSLPSLFYILTWLFCSYLMKRYRPLRRQRYFSAVLKLFYASLFVFLAYAALLYYFFKPYSGYVLLTTTSGVFLVNYIFLSLYFAYRFAEDYNDVEHSVPDERLNAIVRPSERLDEESIWQIKLTILGFAGVNVLKMLDSQVDLTSRNTLLYVDTSVENMVLTPKYHYSTIVQLEKLNNMKGIHKMLAVLNEKLPDNGMFVCCFESKSTRKKRILKKYPPVLNYAVYSCSFIFKRIMPKIFLTHKLYYFITRGKNRVLSKTEVLGRLYCFGFKVVREKKVGNLTWVFAQRVKQPEALRKRIYGPLIRLRRFGKNREYFYVYKMRTMHPYSEYLQAYIYERNSLQEGGKFNKDIRVTTSGRFMRKYWLDELPMIFNLLHGDMKLIGVRPLSAHYFSLYSQELQQKRVKFKPGLLPPFYADMPKTLEEIQASEMKYLCQCEKYGTLMTDVKYFFLIVKNILFKSARSA